MSDLEDLRERLIRLDQMIGVQTEVLEKQQALMKELRQAREFTATLLLRLERPPRQPDESNKDKMST